MPAPCIESTMSPPLVAAPAIPDLPDDRLLADGHGDISAPVSPHGTCAGLLGGSACLHACPCTSESVLDGGAGPLPRQGFESSSFTRTAPCAGGPAWFEGELAPDLHAITPSSDPVALSTR